MDFGHTGSLSAGGAGRRTGRRTLESDAHLTRLTRLTRGVATDVVLPRMCEYARHFRRKHGPQQVGLPDMPLRIPYYEAGQKLLVQAIWLLINGT